MARTRAELVNRVLKRLGIVGAGQTAFADQYATIDEELDSVLANLRTRGVIDIDPDDIDDAAFQPLALTIACELAGDFGANVIIGFPNVPVSSVGSMAEGQLRALANIAASDEPIPFTSY